MEDIFARQDQALTGVFHRGRVTIFGCGGLGSNVATALARAGVGHLTLVDFDDVAPSNLNRQAYTQADLGRPKALALKEYIQEITPLCQVNVRMEKITRNNLETFLSSGEIYVEALDGAAEKEMLFDFFLDRPDCPYIGANGVSGLGTYDEISVRHWGHMTLVGDFKSTQEEGLYLPYVGLIALIEANEVLQILKEEV